MPPHVHPRCRKFELGLLEADGAGGDKQAERVRGLYSRQLQVPLQDGPATLDEYTAWEAKQGKVGAGRFASISTIMPPAGVQLRHEGREGPRRGREAGHEGEGQGSRRWRRRAGKQEMEEKDRKAGPFLIGAFLAALVLPLTIIRARACHPGRLGRVKPYENADRLLASGPLPLLCEPPPSAHPYPSLLCGAGGTAPSVQGLC